MNDIEEHEGLHTAEELFQWLLQATELLDMCEDTIRDELLANSKGKNFDKNYSLYLDIKVFNSTVWGQE